MITLCTYIHSSILCSNLCVKIQMSYSTIVLANSTYIFHFQPSVVEQLRKWTSKEAIGDVTALPDSSMRIANSVTLTPDELSECGSGDDEPIDHRLPSPDEQLRIIASK